MSTAKNATLVQCSATRLTRSWTNSYTAYTLDNYPAIYLRAQDIKGRDLHHQKFVIHRDDVARLRMLLQLVDAGELGRQALYNEWQREHPGINLRQE